MTPAEEHEAGQGAAASDTRAGTEGAGLVCKERRWLVRRGYLTAVFCYPNGGYAAGSIRLSEVLSERTRGKNGDCVFAILRGFQNPAGYAPEHPDLTLRLVLLRAGGWTGDLQSYLLHYIML